MRRLPPLTAIEAFVHVARLGSIKHAADELALSSPALSRRIQALERFIGKPLFERRHQALVLNGDGERLLALVSPALDTLSDAVEQMSGAEEVLRLRLGVLPLFAIQRLMPRMGDLRRRHPQLHLDIDTAHHSLARLGEGIDVAIVLAHSVDPALYAKRLDRNRVYAIAGRSLIERSPIAEPKDLAAHTALIHRDMPDTFTDWRRAAGLPGLSPAAIDQFDSGTLMLEATAQGLGVAFMLESHVEMVRDPRLVNLLDMAVDSTYSHGLVSRPRMIVQRPVRLFHDWLVEALGADAV